MLLCVYIRDFPRINLCGSPSWLNFSEITSHRWRWTDPAMPQQHTGELCHRELSFLNTRESLPKTGAIFFFYLRFDWWAIWGQRHAETWQCWASPLPHTTTPLHLTLRALSLLLPLSIFISNSSSLAGYFQLYSLRQPPPIARVINCSHLLFPFPFLFFNLNKKRNQ